MNTILNCTGMEIFVAPDGNDGGPGDRAKPFRTLARARDAIRERKRAARLSGAVTVWLRGGRYPLHGDFRVSVGPPKAGSARNGTRKTERCDADASHLLSE